MRYFCNVTINSVMRIKYLAIYLLAGAAFLAVSLWVFLSDGRNARAIRAKYKLGGILLMASAMLTAASCGRPPFVTCYDPVVPNEVVVVDEAGREGEVKSGDVLKVIIQGADYPAYRCRITAQPEDGEEFLIQEEYFEPVEGVAEFELKIVETEYKGEALLKVYGLNNNGSSVDEYILPGGIVHLTII